MIGFDKRVSEPDLNVPPASGVTSGWVTLHEWSRSDALALNLLGPAWLYGHVGADLGQEPLKGEARKATFPRQIGTQWLRSSADGLTGRHLGYFVGEIIKWADGASDPEYLTIDDFPLRFQVLQVGGVFVVRKAIATIDTTDSRIASRIAP